MVAQGFPKLADRLIHCPLIGIHQGGHRETKRLQAAGHGFRVIDRISKWSGLSVGGVADHECMASHCTGSLDTLDSALCTKGRKREQKEGKCKQKLAVDMFHRASLG
ncbi:MAG: hypothetical protein QF922_00440 [SAR324 cluster bacterium]|nr:hypothetical protein [SAR324 cluster bacterium]